MANKDKFQVTITFDDNDSDIIAAFKSISNKFERGLFIKGVIRRYFGKEMFIMPKIQIVQTSAPSPVPKKPIKADEDPQEEPSELPEGFDDGFYEGLEK
jgi:hypothetical protein